MNILFLYDSPLKQDKGGTERATWLVMQELERRGHHCMGFLHFNQECPDEYFLNNVRIESLTEFLDKNKIDVVVNQIAFHYWLLKEFLVHGGQDWKEKGGKIISFMHFDPSGKQKIYIGDLFQDFAQKTLWKKIKRCGLIFYIPVLLHKATKVERMSYHYIYENSDAYVVMSPSYIAPFLVKAGIQDKNKMNVITNMLTFPENIDATLIPLKENIVIVVARLDEKQKRISKILKIWKKIKAKNWKLQIIGTGQDEDFYKRMVNRLHISNVEFLGHRNPEPYYRKAKIFLMTSPHEGWGLTITESMQNGVVPIVLNTSSVFKDIISDGMDGYLPNNMKDMLVYMNQLMAKESICEQMAYTALGNVVRYSSANIGEQWVEMLDKLKTI